MPDHANLTAVFGYFAKTNRTGRMHRLRLWYLVLVAFMIYIKSTCCWTQCEKDFTDVASSAYLADIIFIGKVKALVPPSQEQVVPGKPNINMATFAVKKVIKGGLPKYGKKKKYKHVIAGRFTTALKEVAPCIGKIDVNANYMVFLHNATTGADDTDPRYEVSAAPVKPTKKNRKLIQGILCATCGKLKLYK